MSPLFAKQEKVSLLVNIGSGAISAGLVAFEPKRKPTIIYSVFLSFKMDDAPEKNKLTSVMDSLLGQTLTLVVKNGMALPFWKGKKKNISSAMVSFSSPWFSSKIKKIELQKDKTFVVNQTFLDSILESEKNTFAKELSENEDEKNSDDRIVALENIFTDFKINGYTIKNIVWQKTNKFSASLYVSAVSKSISDIVHNRLAKSFSVKPENIFVGTFPFISSVVAENLFPTLENFLLVDVAAEMTDMVMVSRKSVSEVVSFPSGRNFIIRQIAKKFGVSAEIAESSLHLWSAKKSDTETTDKIQEVMYDVEREWSIYFENAFIELSKNAVLPFFVCLTAGDDVAGLYSDFLKLSKDDGTAEFRKNSQIFHLDAESMSHLYDTDKKFKPNVFLSVLTVFSNLSVN